MASRFGDEFVKRVEVIVYDLRTRLVRFFDKDRVLLEDLAGMKTFCCQSLASLMSKLEVIKLTTGVIFTYLKAEGKPNGLLRWRRLKKGGE